LLPWLNELLFEVEPLRMANGAGHRRQVEQMLKLEVEVGRVDDGADT
jgi:hypothetical protein